MSTHVHSVGRLTLVCFLVSIAGCGGYDEIGPVAYDFSKALYSITNRKAEEKLDEIDQRIEVALEQGELTNRESRWLKDIVQSARDGKWGSANKASRRMMEDQVHKL